MKRANKPIASMTDQRLAAFLAKVEEVDGHWMWCGANTERYGVFWDGCNNVPAHRAAYEHYVGHIPSGMVIDHICHVTMCVRPSHLRAVTHKQNMEHRRGAQANSSTGVRGVSWDADRENYRAVVGHHGRWINAGRYDTVEEATAAVETMRAQLFTHDDALVVAP